jgi:hypothetical protein
MLKKKSIAKLNANAKKVKLQRASEALEEREGRLQQMPVAAAESRARENQEQREIRLEDMRFAAAESRDRENDEQREITLKKKRVAAAESRVTENHEQREIRLHKKRVADAESRAKENEEQREIRLEKTQVAAAESRARENHEHREIRLDKMRVADVESRARENEEQREIRLEKTRVAAAKSTATENHEHREIKLQKMRVAGVESRARENEEQREIRVKRIRVAVTTSRDAENEDQRQMRYQGNRIRSATARRSVEPSELALAAFNYDPHLHYENYPHVLIGKMDKICRHCSAKKYQGEPPGMCCNNGKVRLPLLDSPPDEFLSYMTATTPESRHFLQNIRRYNSCFQMTSFGATSIVEEPGFMPTFKVQGQIYHRIGSLLPCPNQSPKFLQIYFMGDEQLQADQRCQNIPGTRRNIIEHLQRLLCVHNQLINTFTTALEQLPTDEYKVVIRADKRPAGEHERRFNAPQISEVAIVMVGDQFERRDIIIHRRGEALQRISETHRSYDALQYPLMLWRGEDGYHFNIMQINSATGKPTNKKVSAMDFYAYRIMIREMQTNHILNFRQLFHQFIVDMYAKIESERLLYIRLNQTKLRTDEYTNLRDAVANDGNVADIGKLVVLPATFTGSPRHMQEYAQDAMSYVRAYGCPDLFITFTCNPTWPAIKEELIFGQTPVDRHDLTARVFQQKLSKLMDVLTKKKHNIFGEARCWMYSIEWQKRGLPHAHILLWLNNKIRPTQIDSVISAEFPDADQDPILYEVVKRNMIHGPCGQLNPNAPCMKDRKCTKKFPKNLIQETQTGNDGYPQYRRRPPDDGGFTATLTIHGNQEIEVDNKWVVPYSPLLSKMFQAHINVEYCNSVKSIKYICKYVNKGSDMAVFGLANGNRLDEITSYQMGRYISSNEAVWRILNFHIHERHPTVVHLSVHLENGQRVYFTPKTAQRVAVTPPNTTLTAFFKLCQQDPFATTLLYPEVPKYYTWNASRKVFSKRKQGTPVLGQDAVVTDALGRVYTVHPNNAECYFLRMLLHTVPGPTSFLALKTVHGEVCETFREACQKLGLLENDEHWEMTLSEGSVTCFPAQIRNLFAIILTTCNPANPKSLWEKYKDSMSEDVLLQARRNHDDPNINFSPQIFNQALILLEDKCLAMVGKTLLLLGLQAPQRSGSDLLHSEVMRERNYNVEELSHYVQTNKPLLVDDQRTVYNTIMERIRASSGGLLFLNAPGGTGKTFLINLILAEIRMRQEVALAIASSGIAATLMDGGRTAHSALKLPLNIATDPNPICNTSKSSGQAQVLKLCKLIVWDECTMAHKKSLEALNRTLQDLKGSSELMGGTLVVLAGDFRQTLPVISRSTPADELNACLKASPLWEKVLKLELSTNMRIRIQQETDAQEFAAKLLQIGNGTFPIDPQTAEITFTENLCQLVSSIDQLIQKIYPNIEQNFTNHDWLCERAILAPKNDSVNHINDHIQNQIPGTATTYKSFDSAVDTDDAVNYPLEFLNTLEPPGMPSHILKLKKGSPIMLLRNLDPPKLCNGTRLSVKQLLPNVIEANVLTGKAKGEDVFIPRIPLIPTDLPFSFKRVQFPVRLAFAMTINKAQGQSLNFAGVNLETPCFSHGQLYVACSRVGTAKNLYLLAPQGKSKNVVYKQALQ